MSQPIVLIDLLLDFVDQFGCNLQLQQTEGKKITVEIDRCVDHVQKSNTFIREKLCPGYTFQLVIGREYEFIFECVERDLTLVIRYHDTKVKDKQTESPYRYDAPFGMPKRNR